MSTILYILASHNFHVIPAQLELFRELVDDLSRIIVVQGPLGTTGVFDAGARHLSAETARELGVELFEVTPQLGGWGIITRVPGIIAEIRVHSFAQPERFALVVHADVLPASRVNVPALLDGCQLVGRGCWKKGMRQLYETWQAWDSEAPEMQETMVDFLQIIGPAKVKLYEVQIPTDDFWNVYFFEWCTPCFLHLNQGSFLDEAMTRKKMEGAAKYLNRELPCYDPSSVLMGPLPQYRLRCRFPRHMRPRAQEKAVPFDQQRVADYLASVQRWFNADRPQRTYQEALAIVAEHCSQCPQYQKDADKCMHDKCGLQGNESGLQYLLEAFDSRRAITNKIRLATEHCPLWNW